MDTLTFKVVGDAPLITHNARLANPLDPLVRQIKVLTAKRKKTEEDQLAIFRLEWEGGLYFADEVGPYIPGENIEATIKEAARLQKRGKDVQRGLFVPERQVPLIYKGPREPDPLYDSEKFTDVRCVVIGGRRTMRCRPMFQDWSLEFVVSYDSEVLNSSDVQAFVNDAGRYVGLCEMRPRYGKFSVANGKK